MREVDKAQNRTKLRIGEIEVPAGIFKAHGDPPGKPKYESAGPNGHPLKAVQKVVRAPSPPKDAPLEDPGPEAPPVFEQAAAEAAAGDPGEYRQILVEEVTGQEVAKDAVRRGIRRANGNFVDLTEHLAEIEEDAKLEAMEVLTFIDRRNVPTERIVGGYYVSVGGTLGPRLGKALYHGMSESGRVAVVRWTKRKGQTLGVLGPHPSGALLARELVWAEDVRRPNDECLWHQRATVTETEVEQAKELIGAMAGKRADLDDLADRRRSAERELIARAEAGELDEYTLEPEDVPDEMGDLAELLAASVPASA